MAAQFVFGAPLHPHQHPAAGGCAVCTVPAGPRVDVVGNRPPAAQVEITHTEVSPLRDAHRLLECGHQLAIFSNVVENLGHG